MVSSAATRVQALQLEEHAARLESVPAVIEGLKKLYRDRVLPVELAYSFDKFHTPSLVESDFDARPMVLVLGQYSVGKTSFIQYIAQRESESLFMLYS